MIEEIDFNGYKLAKLTRDNVAIVEAMIRNDSAYIRTSEKLLVQRLIRKEI